MFFKLLDILLSLFRSVTIRLFISFETIILNTLSDFSGAPNVNFRKISVRKTI